MAMLFVWMEAWVHWAKYLGFEWYNRLKWLVVQVLSIVALLIVLVWLAVFMYGSFYYTYMPAVTHTREVHLQFGFVYIFLLENQFYVSIFVVKDCSFIRYWGCGEVAVI